MKKLVVCLIALLFMSQMAVADYILISGGGGDTSANAGQSIIRYRDDFRIVWERSPALGIPETTVFDTVEISPLDRIYGGGDVYTCHYLNDRFVKHLAWETGDYIGRPVPTSTTPVQTDGTGKYTPRANNVLQDIQFGYDYNGDGVADLWVARRDYFEVYDGKTLNRPSDTGVADILTWIDIADANATNNRNGTGGFGFTFGPDVTGDGIGELYALKGVNTATGSRLNVWNPVTITQVASYNTDGTRDSGNMILGPDVNGDGKQDLWVQDARNHRIRAYDCATGALVAGSISFVKAGDPNTAVTLRFPTDIKYGPDGTILITTRFATSLDPQWTAPADIAGGNLLKIVWDPVSQKGLTTLLFEHTARLDGVAYAAIDPTKAAYPYPAHRAQDMLRDVELSWTPGIYAAKHNVYFGTDFNDVNEATVDSTRDVLVAPNYDPNKYDPPGLLDWGQTYYWRVDEVNAPAKPGLYKGSVWSFTVTNFTVVDDFEAYNDINNLIYNTWLDCVLNNTGMTVGHLSIPVAETLIIRSGKQSMYMCYDNDGSINTGLGPPLEMTGTKYYSEAERMWEIPQDWTKDGAATLSLWLRGLIAPGSYSAGPPIKMTSSGTDIAAYPDQFHFAYVKLSGEGSVTAKVVSLVNTDGWAKAGVMMRDGLDSGSKYAAVVMTPSNGISFRYRINVNGGSTEAPRPTGIVAPYWVRLTRTGNKFSAERSADGSKWEAIGTPVDITMNIEVYVGLCLTSRTIYRTTEAEFSDVQIVATGSGAVTGQWQSQDIGTQTNVPDQLYVVLQDSTGRDSPAVKYSGSAATATPDWAVWPIPLTEFTGINLADIKKMTIGVGDRASTQPRLSSGTLYIDDIRLYQP